MSAGECHKALGGEGRVGRGWGAGGLTPFVSQMGTPELLSAAGRVSMVEGSSNQECVTGEGAGLRRWRCGGGEGGQVEGAPGAG